MYICKHRRIYIYIYVNHYSTGIIHTYIYIHSHALTHAHIHINIYITVESSCSSCLFSWEKYQPFYPSRLGVKQHLYSTFPRMVLALPTPWSLICFKKQQYIYIYIYIHTHICLCMYKHKLKYIYIYIYIYITGSAASWVEYSPMVW